MRTPRVCGGCTACCKLTGVPELHKPMNEWCAHCAIGKGCTVYHVRPQSCKDFACVWLQGAGPDSMRPDRSRVVMFRPNVPMDILVVQVAANYPDAWQQGAVHQFIKGWLADPTRVALIVQTGTGTTKALGTDQFQVQRAVKLANNMRTLVTP